MLSIAEAAERVGRSPGTVPAEWRKLEDETPAPNRVAAVALSRVGR
jgi:hypothetical protein